MKFTKETVANITTKYNLSMFSVLSDLEKASFHNKAKIFEKWMESLLIDNVCHEINDSVEMVRVLQKILTTIQQKNVKKKQTPVKPPKVDKNEKNKKNVRYTEKVQAMFSQFYKEIAGIQEQWEVDL